MTAAERPGSGAAAETPGSGAAETPSGGPATGTHSGSPAAGTPSGGPAAETPAGSAAGGLAYRLAGLGRTRIIALAAVVTGIVVIVGLSFTGVGAGSPHTPPPTPAKNFSLQALGHPARQIALNSLAGRPVIVNFFASWCTPCRKETPLLARFFRTRHGSVAVIGIDVSDQAAAALAFVHRSGVTYPVATEPASDSTVIAYDLPGLPATFFLDAQHRIVKRVYGAVTQAELASGTALMDAQAK